MKTQLKTQIKHLFFLGVLLFSSHSYFWGQNYVSLGTGTGNTGFGANNPFYNFASGSAANGMRYQCFISATELANASVPSGSLISSVGFNITQAATGNAAQTNLSGWTVTVYKTTSVPGANSTFFTGTPIAVSTTADLNVGSTGWTETTFPPFVWNTGENIIIETCFFNAYNLNYARVQQTNMTSLPTRGSRYITSTNAGVCGLGGNANTTNRPNIRLSWGSAAGCSGTPDAGTASINISSGCSGQTVNLEAANVSGGTGISYQWQSAPASTGPWTDISGANSLTLSTVANATTFYRLQTTCSNSGGTNQTNVVSFTSTGTGCAGTCITSIPSLPVVDQSVSCSPTNNLNAGNVSACGPASTNYFAGQEALYAVTAPATGPYTISYSGQTWSAIWVWSGGCPNSGGTCVGSVGNTNASKSLTIPMTQGETYYIMFDTWANGQPISPCPGTFSIEEAVCTYSNNIGTINAPTTLNSPTNISTCVFAGQFSTVNNVANGSAYTFTSSVSTDFLVLTDGSNNILTTGTTPISWTSNFSGTVRLHVSTNPFCGTQSSCRTTAVTLTCATPAQPGSVSGASSICEQQSGQSYSIASVTNASNYTWTVPSGWTINSGQGTTQISATSGNAGQNGQISVVAESSCGTSTPATLAVESIVCNNCSGTPNAGTASIDFSSGCDGTAFEITATGISTDLGISYQWQEANSSSGPWSDIVGETALVFASSASGSKFYRLQTTCANSTETNETNVVSFNSLGISCCTYGSAFGTANAPTTLNNPVTITGFVYAGQYNTINNVVNGNTYEFTSSIATDVLVLSDASNNVLTSGITPLSWTANYSGTVRLHISSSINCNSGVDGIFRTTTVALTCVTPEQPIIFGPNQPCAQIENQPYSVGTVIGATTYNWSVPSGWSIESGNGTETILVNTGSVNQHGIIQVTAQSSCGISAPQILEVTLPAASTELSGNGGSRSCLVHKNGWVDFYSNNGGLIASINSEGQDLGNVTMAVIVASEPYQKPSCDALSSLAFTQTVMGRSFVITPQHQPAVGTSVQVRFYINDVEFSAYQIHAANNDNPNDGAANLSAMDLSKVSGGANSGNPMDLCDEDDAIVQYIEQNMGGSGSLASLPNFTGFSDASYLDFTITGFSEFFLMNNSENSPLPVSLTAFSATCDADKTLVSWTTASEFNASHYFLQISRDGMSWLDLAEIEAAGTTNQTSNYSFSDQNFGVLTYYRLVQVDNDGEQAVYGPISSNCNLENNLLIAHPNPAKESFAIMLTSNQTIDNAQVELRDMSGRMIMSRQTKLNIGSTMLNFDVRDIQSGTYIIRVKGENARFTPIRVVKL